MLILGFRVSKLMLEMLHSLTVSYQTEGLESGKYEKGRTRGEAELGKHKMNKQKGISKTWVSRNG